MARHGGAINFEKGFEDIIDFSANINPLGLPLGVKEAICNGLDSSTVYPDIYSTRLRKSISKFEDINMDSIFCSNGASDIIFRIVSIIRPQKAIVLAPTFSDYERALKSYGASVEYYYLDPEDDFEITDNILTKLEEGFDMFFVCNPNNPTGVATDVCIMKKILEKCKSMNTYLVVDECFTDFVNDKEKYSLKPFLSDYDNLLILKAFTKIFAMAGLRLGYCLTENNTIIKKLYLHGADWSVSNIAQIAGEVALINAKEYINQTLDYIDLERVKIINALNELGYKTYGSMANYIFIENNYNFNLNELLLKEKVNIRECFDYNGLAIKNKYYRVGVMEKNKNQFFIEKLIKVTNNFFENN